MTRPSKKDTDPHGIVAAMDLVKEVEGTLLWECSSNCFNDLILRRLVKKARRIRKKFKNDYDKAGGKL